MQANPYDRRAEPRRHTRTLAESVDVSYSGPFDELDDGRRAYPGFTLAKLEDLLRDEFARGFNSGEGTMERHVEENILPSVRRNVWDQGHTAGIDDGETALLKRIDEQFGEEVRDLITDAEPVLASDSKVEDLRPLLAKSVILLIRLVDSHHAGFAAPPPF